MKKLAKFTKISTHNPLKDKLQNQKNPNVSVDCVIFAFDQTGLEVLLLQRSGRDGLDLQDETLVLPGDLINDNEDLDEAARRVLFQLSGLKDIYLKQLAAFGSPDRLKKEKDQIWLNAVRVEPDARVITIGYYSLIHKSLYQVKPSGFAKSAEWYAIDKVPELGFDHSLIFQKALTNLRQRIYTEPIGFELLPKKFSLHELLTLYEAILDVDIDKRNFRRKILKTGLIRDTEEYQQGVPHKPAKLFEFDKSKVAETHIDAYRFF